MYGVGCHGKGLRQVMLRGRGYIRMVFPACRVKFLQNRAATVNSVTRSTNT